jgi:twitching motility protein PilT
MDSFFDRALAAARQLGASDVHLKPGLAPILRINGELRTLRDVPPLARDFLHSLAMSLLNDRRREILERTGDVTVALTTPTNLRLRLHVSQQRGGFGIAARLIPAEVPPLDSLGLPAEVRDLLVPGGGLILVAAPPGHGRSTTLASLLDDLGTRHPCHVVTIEDPVELLAKDRRSVVVQREVGLDVASFAAGLRAAVRLDADVLMVSELEDGETAELAVAAAENGQLVLAGLVAGSPTGAIDRVTALWETGAQRAARARLGAVLRGVLFQRLITTPNGKGRTASAELLHALPPSESPDV